MDCAGRRYRPARAKSSSGRRHRPRDGQTNPRSHTIAERVAAFANIMIAAADANSSIGRPTLPSLEAQSVG